MSEHPDLGPAAQTLQRLAENVSDDQLAGPTPCAGRTVSQLLGHVVGSARAFRACAEKDLGEWTDVDPSDAGWPDVEPGWRETLAQRLPALVEAWRDEEAWQGMTRAGGVDLPGEVAGLVALDELVLHGWDLARATGQEYHCDEATAAAVLEFVSQFDSDGTPGLFGPARQHDADASVLEQALARAGRDPRWSPA